MSFAVQDLLEEARAARKHFLRHVKGVTSEQWDWKPYPECNSVRETLAHLISDDRAMLQSLEEEREPDYESCQESERDADRLLALLSESHERLFSHIEKTYGEAPLDAEVHVWSGKTKLGRMLAMLSSEDFYHAGQVAFIRMATNPGWDYYADIYRSGE